MVWRCFFRDLKPENFLLLNKADSSPLKATDFGLSVFYKPGQKFTDIVGSAYYVAPEVRRSALHLSAVGWGGRSDCHAKHVISCHAVPIAGMSVT